jgi:hypothetical protein
MLQGAFSWQSFLSMSFGVLMLSALLFIDWRSLIQKKEFKVNFRIWK